MVIAPPERWRQIETLFAEAMDLSPAERAELLRARVDDPALRDDLERLLAAHDRSDGFLEELDRSRCAALLETAGEGLATDGTIGPYRIVRLLGRGGMGVVYLARDSRLGRSVALKLLPRRRSEDDLAKRRFTDEAKAASALDHPHIAPIYEMGEAPDGRLYIAMAYCEGETLRERIARGPLPIDDALTLARQIVDGLAAAHAAGIVHRDIKPGNVIVNPNGSARIVDFGVARTAGDALTQPGATLGTIAYMSPEQTFGERVDPRTDLWSVGVTLYEMLAGVRPFRADDDQALIYAIRNDEPRPLRVVRTDVPADVERIVARCLTKNTDDRYPDARSLLADLDGASRGERRVIRWPIIRARVGRSAIVVVAALVVAAWWQWSQRQGVGSADAADSRIVVVPFTPVGADRDTTLERLGRELVITISASLDGAAGLHAVEPITVLAQTEAGTSTTTPEDAARLARRLGAGRVVHGTLIRSAGRVRVDAGIFDVDGLTPRGRVAASASDDDVRTLTDVISIALLRHLATGGEIQSTSVAAITTSSVPALRAFLAGEQAIARAQFRVAPEHFARAIAADSSFWLAYWRYAYARGYHGERVDSAITATVLAHLREFPEADRLLIESRFPAAQRARLAKRQEITRLFPNYWPAWFELGDQLTHQGPYLGETHVVTRAALERTIELNPAFVPAWEHLFWIENRIGDTIATARILRHLDEVRASPVKQSDWNLSTLTFYHCLHDLTRSGGGLSEECAAAGVRDLVGYRGPMNPERLALQLAQMGFFRAAIDLADRIQAEPSSPPDLVAAHWLSKAIASAGRGDWTPAIQSAERYARSAPHQHGALWAYGLAVTGAWLGTVDATAVTPLRGAAVRSAAARTPEGEAELAWLDGLLAFTRGDTAALAGGLAALGRSGAGSAPTLVASLGAFALAARGDSAGAARQLAALEWNKADSARHFWTGQRHPYFNSVNRLAASRWLVAAGDTTGAERLLRWHEADFPGTTHPLQAVNVALGTLALFEQARIEAATGRPELAAKTYQRFLQRYDRAPAIHQAMTERARVAVPRR